MITENGQAHKAEVFALLDISCRQVSETYGKPDWDTWTNSDYVSLSHILFRQTHVRISPNTLKRIFGKIKTDSRYYPQKATRDALAAYIGHPDWDHFVKVQEWTVRRAVRLPDKLVPEETMPTLPTTTHLPIHSSPKKTKRNRWLPVLIAGALLLIVAMLFVQQRRSSSDLAQLICRNPLGENPHSAVFQLKYPNSPVRSGAYSILFGDGKRERLNANDSLATHYYERPGRYFAVLQRDGMNIDTSTVYLQTKGWTVTANMMHDTSRVYPIEVAHLFTGGRRSVSAPEAARAGIDTNRTFFMEFINSHPTRINGDNFELTTHLRTSPDRAGVRCSQIGITVWGESSQHMFEVMRPGCAHWILLQNSDVQKSGQRDDLSFMGADLRSGGMLTLRVIDKQAAIFINNQQVYKTSYTKPLHRIYGVKIRFAGVGTVDSFSLNDLKTGSVFDGSF
ncbi:hypothetical protein GK091_25185 [Spirosoma agri]|uniref:PKD domain-containing protein n=1 Tax=Spirosoma agri TaxID=1987381 RepID=A0A6M0IPI3_9BACT|nr:hypothetical protein [Spirosoma agri]NEU70196.1 hypothetical protein [Spirosoma agri]